ncbi:MAG: peptidase T4 [Alphaproteobacteria bacterium]|nr:peptidase T4 [Alphaproteobacteria bacterium]
MNRPGPKNALTDVAGLAVGHAEHATWPTGTTVVVAEEAAVAAADQRGGAPGTRELALMEPGCLVERVDAVVLSGGSAYGLAAADGVVDRLAAAGRGFAAGPARVPIVPALILFDLALGPPERDTAAYRELGARAFDARGDAVGLGDVGAGRGATCGALKAGIGSASITDAATGATVAALAAVNAAGSAVMPGTDTLWAWAFEQEGEFGGQVPPAGPIAAEVEIAGLTGENTTLVVVATDAALDRPQAKRLAVMAQDGLARALRPVHTPFDGDTVVALATGRSGPVDAIGLARLGAHAADVTARAIAKGVVTAGALDGVPAYRDRRGR